jgi:UDP-N-acetylglucosamine--N-acetylmuramyl-(pentapeptide) pyrophosphoryl-undecaprenol N-acetylglucosamine transferase
MDPSDMRVVIAGGGTGGHLYPGITLAKEIRKRHPGGAVLFVGTSEGLEARILPKEGFELKTIPVTGWKGKKGMERMRALFFLPLALARSFSLLRSFHPDAVIGVGGFASGPLVAAAWLMGKKVMIQEQNSVPGLTNRLLGRFADRIYTAYEEAQQFFPPRKVLLTGNPLRAWAWQGDRKEAKQAFGLDPNRLTVLILGGSRGAHAVNELVAKMVEGPKWPEGMIQFLHQTGEADWETISDRYRRCGIQAVVKPYLYEMDQAYRAADLAVSRAGAVALSELCAAGVPSILIPFPYAADAHQLKNAHVLERIGAAEVLPQQGLTPERLGMHVRRLMEDGERLGKMRRAALSQARPDAAQRVVDDVERRVRGEGRNEEEEKG